MIVERYNSYQCIFQAQLSETWSKHAVCERLDNPIKDPVVPLQNESSNFSTPQYLVEPADLARLGSDVLLEGVILIALGQAYISTAFPSRDTGTPLPYCAPELLLNSSASFASDVWALTCTLSAIRAGTPPFVVFLNSFYEIVRQIVKTLG